MCGIYLYKGVGFHGVDKRRLRTLIGHRGPDEFGTWSDPENHLLLAHSRLAIQDLTSSARQPMSSPDNRYTIVFNGEIFNFRDLRKTHLASQAFLTNSDTEVLLKMWTLMGKDCLSYLEGMFAFIVYDSVERELHVVRDRFGIKPLYIYQDSSRTIICSEIKPILEEVIVQEDEQTISDFLEDGLIDHSERTFFKGISHFAPASHMIISHLGTVLRNNRYYSLPAPGDTHDKKTLEEKMETLVEVLETVVRQSLVSDCKIAINLSNGADSSLLASIVKRLGYDPKAFTQFYGHEIDGECSGQSEMDIYSLREYIAVSTDNVRETIKETHWHQEEPYSGLFIDGYSALYKHARNLGYKVFLDGNGLDELFLGYRKYRTTKYPRVLGPQSIDDTFRPWSLLETGFQERTRKFAHDYALNAREHSLLDLSKYKIPRGLRFNDKVSMQHGCELRVPFLDHRLLEIAVRFSQSELQDNDTGKLPLRKILSSYTNYDFAYKGKNHKQSPQTEWLRGALLDLLEEVLHSGSVIQDGIVSKLKFEKVISGLKSGSLKNSYQAWQVLSLEVWRSLFITNRILA